MDLILANRSGRQRPDAGGELPLMLNTSIPETNGVA
jgi:hypothetical protein